MKKNKVLKLLIIFILIVIVSLVFSTFSYSWTPQWEMLDDTSLAQDSTTAVTSIMGAVVNIISVIGAGIAIIMLVVLGIRYVTQSASGKAEVKKDVPSYVIGAVILFATSGILKLLQMFIDANVNSV